MEAQVRSFNNLPRSRETPSGLLPSGPNHWIFGVCNSIHPIGDLFLAVNVGNKQGSRSGLSRILSFPTIQEQAEATIPYLLGTFANTPSHGLPIPLFAPWTWSTLDPDMAQAIEDSLQQHGVNRALCKVGVCTAEERDILEAARGRAFATMTRLAGDTKRDPVDPGDNTKCHGCQLSRKCFFKPFKKCSRCQTAFYHSEECQRKQWKHHKNLCIAPSATAGIGASDTNAPTNPELGL